jgi:hypothetical protein
VNYFGYEDDILLRPSEEWPKKHSGQPFMVKCLMGTGHHEFPSLRVLTIASAHSHGRLARSEEDRARTFCIIRDVDGQERVEETALPNWNRVF